MHALLLSTALAAHVVAPAGYGGPSWARLWGRVLEGAAPVPANPTAGGLANARDTLGLLESDEIEGASVAVSIGGRELTARTDDDGVFSFEATDLTLAPGALEVEVRLLEPESAATRTVVHVLDCPGGTAVISDIDDTVVQTHVTDKARMIVQLATTNAAQLEPAPGMAAMYRAAQSAGACGFFYVSSSPQNLYPRLAEFLARAGYPAGPIFLKNIGQDALTDHGGYKTSRIETLLLAYPATRFVLVGDSGEQDPQIYRAVRAALPERVRGIFIRELPERPVRADDIVVLAGAGADERAIVRVLAP
jgi:phosphatidate phosphatase APP1